MNNYILMPRPIPVGENELTALRITLAEMRNLLPCDTPEESIAVVTSFLQTAPFLTEIEQANRGMLRELIGFGRQVMQDTNFLPWLRLQPSVSIWLPWAERRAAGGGGDSIDAASLSVERATSMLPIMATRYRNIKRRAYHTDLPAEFSAWCIYSESRGFSVFALPDNDNVTPFGIDDALRLCVLMPIKAVIAGGWRLRDGFVVSKGSVATECARQTETDSEWFEYEKGG